LRSHSRQWVGLSGMKQLVAVEGHPCASWELKCLERDILCYGTKPDMPELRASNDLATHDGER